MTCMHCKHVLKMAWETTCFNFHTTSKHVLFKLPSLEDQLVLQSMESLAPVHMEIISLSPSVKCGLLHVHTHNRLVELLMFPSSE